MLSYQHAYHAGGPADLHKHAALARLIAALTAKPRGITYMETHAGRGLYDLAAPETACTGEAAAGVLAGGALPEPLAGVLARVRARHGPAAYPGSPLIARTLLRPQDRLILMELHPAEHAGLRRALAGPGVAIHRRDGFEGALALSPPEPRRGLVLIDPSWEVKADYARVPAFVDRLRARWPEAVVLVWYPVLPDRRHAAMRSAFARAGAVIDEVAVPPLRPGGMEGSGLAGFNLPWGFALSG
jgi:23S rRNA (adenine2030-N6)-methyltransferase